MVLSDDFYYQPIKLDTINTQVYTGLLAKEGDAGGRGLKVTLTENGVVKDTTGIDLNLKWEHTSVAELQGLEPFESVDLTKGIYKLKYPTNMLQKGTVKAFIQIIDNGGLAGSRNIKITVDSTVGDDMAMESSNEFTALVTALVKTNHMENLLNEAIANVTVDSEVITARNSTAKQKTFTVLDERMEELENDVYYPANNELTEADFDTTTGWSVYQGTLAVASNVASVTGTSGTYPNVYQDVNCEVGDKLYYAAQARVTTAGAVAITLRSEGVELSTDNARVLDPVAGEWYQLDCIKTAFETTPSFAVSQRYALAADATGKVLQVKKPIALNLTKIFGANAIPTIEQIRAILSRFTDSHFVGNEGLSQPALLMGKALSLEAQFNAAVAGLTVDDETINARVGKDNTTHATLKARLDSEKSTTDQSLVSLGQQLEQTNILSAEAVAKADAMASGSPKGVYATLALLQSAYPTGTTGAYLVTADGNWYYWSGSTWSIGGLYQGVGIADGTITATKLDNNFRYRGSFTSPDLNALLAEGNYLISGTPTNLPSGSNNSGYLNVSIFYDSIIQTFINYGTSNVGWTRYIRGTTFGDWKKMQATEVTNITRSLLSADYNAYTVPSTLGSGTNLNYLISEGYYFIVAGATNVPPTFTGSFFLEVKRVSTNFSIQIAYELNAPERIFSRQITNGAPTGVYIWKNTSQSAQADRNWIAMGDSITGTAFRYFYRTRDLLQVNGTNAGVGGSSMASRPGETYALYEADAFVNKSAVLDFSVQNLLTVFFGTNDFSSNVLMGAIDSVDPTTFNGAMNVGLANVYASNPVIDIMFITPIWRVGWDTPNTQGLTLKDYVDAIIAFCERNNIACYDAFRKSGINALNQTSYLSDGLHPTEFGGDKLGSCIASAVKSSI